MNQKTTPPHSCDVAYVATFELNRDDEGRAFQKYETSVVSSGALALISAQFAPVCNSGASLVLLLPDRRTGSRSSSPLFVVAGAQWLLGISSHLCPGF